MTQPRNNPCSCDEYWCSMCRTWHFAQKCCIYFSPLRSHAQYRRRKPQQPAAEPQPRKEGENHCPNNANADLTPTVGVSQTPAVQSTDTSNAPRNVQPVSGAREWWLQVHGNYGVSIHPTEKSAIDCVLHGNANQVVHVREVTETEEQLRQQVAELTAQNERLIGHNDANYSSYQKQLADRDAEIRRLENEIDFMKGTRL